MAAVGRITASRLLNNSTRAPFQICKLSTAQSWTRGRKLFWSGLGVAAGGAGALLLALESSVHAGEEVIHPPTFQWPSYGPLNSYDHASLRRGYEVYKNVCSACHSMKYLRYRELVGVTHTENEAKDEAAAIMVRDGPNDIGEMFDRPGKLSDSFPSPYPNEEAARAANGGAYPPDLSYIVAARHGGENYIFSLLTGYHEAPAGLSLREGLHFNPYFPGGAIGMAQALYNEIIEYEDGTPATQSQLAKDVTHFLMWASFPELEERKEIGIKATFVMALIFFTTWYLKRFRFSTLKTRKIMFNPPKKE